jgi:hypothetical protein
MERALSHDSFDFYGSVGEIVIQNISIWSSQALPGGKEEKRNNTIKSTLGVNTTDDCRVNSIRSFPPAHGDWTWDALEVRPASRYTQHKFLQFWYRKVTTRLWFLFWDLLTRWSLGSLRKLWKWSLSSRTSIWISYIDSERVQHTLHIRFCIFYREKLDFSKDQMTMNSWILCASI